MFAGDGRRCTFEGGDAQVAAQAGPGGAPRHQDEFVGGAALIRRQLQRSVDRGR